MRLIIHGRFRVLSTSTRLDFKMPHMRNWRGQRGVLNARRALQPLFNIRPWGHERSSKPTGKHAAFGGNSEVLGRLREPRQTSPVQGNLDGGSTIKRRKIGVSRPRPSQQQKDDYPDERPAADLHGEMEPAAAGNVPLERIPLATH